MNIKKISSPKLKDWLRTLQNKHRATDTLGAEGKITAEASSRLCGYYEQEIRRIKKELKRRTRGLLTHNPFKVLEERLQK